MAEFTDRWRIRLRSAQRDLIDACGGIERVGTLLSLGKSTVGRWRSPTDDDLMTIRAAMVLEEDCGRPLVTQVMAEFTGRRVTDPDERAEKIACLTGQVAELIGQASQLMARTAQAGADNHFTVAEINDLQRLNGDVRRVADDLESVLATAKAAGGLSLVKGV